MSNISIGTLSTWNLQIIVYLLCSLEVRQQTLTASQWCNSLNVVVKSTLLIIIYQKPPRVSSLYRLVAWFVLTWKLIMFLFFCVFLNLILIFPASLVFQCIIFILHNIFNCNIFLCKCLITKCVYYQSICYIDNRIFYVIILASASKIKSLNLRKAASLWSGSTAADASVSFGRWGR